MANERQELDRLRKMKRLRELESREVQNVATPIIDNSTVLPDSGIESNVNQLEAGSFDAQPVQQPIQQAQAPTVGDEALGGLDVAKTIVSSAVAEPIAGLAGLITSPFVGVEQATKNIDAVKEFITLEPTTVEGQRNLKVVGQLVEKGVDLANIPASGLVGLGELLTGQGAEQAAESVAGGV